MNPFVVIDRVVLGAHQSVVNVFDFKARWWAHQTSIVFMIMNVMTCVFFGWSFQYLGGFLAAFFMFLESRYITLAFREPTILKSTAFRVVIFLGIICLQGWLFITEPVTLKNALDMARGIAYVVFFYFMGCSDPPPGYRRGKLATNT